MLDMYVTHSVSDYHFLDWDLNPGVCNSKNIFDYCYKRFIYLGIQRRTVFTN